MEKKVEGKYRKRRRSSLAEHRRRGREVNKNVCSGENFVFLMMPDLMLLYLKINIHQKKKKVHQQRASTPHTWEIFSPISRRHFLLSGVCKP